MFEELQKLAFPKHAYGRPVIGFEEDLNRMTTTDCENFYDRYYAPNNAFICVVGNLSHQKVFKTIQKHYGKIESSEIKRHKISSEPPQTEERRKTMPLSLQVEKAYMGYRVPAATNEDHVPMTILSTVLSTGRSSRLYKALVDKGFTIDVSAGSGNSKESSLFYITFSAQAGKKAEAAIEVLDKELQNLQDALISDEELNRAKSKLRTEFFMGLSTNAAKANFLGQNEIVLGGFQRALEDMDKVLQVKKEAVRDVARKYFHAKNRSIIIGIPS